MISTDVAIIGGGIVGLATAYQLTRDLPGRRVTVLEKEAALGPAPDRSQLGSAAFRHLLQAQLAEGDQL